MSRTWPGAGVGRSGVRKKGGEFGCNTGLGRRRPGLTNPPLQQVMLTRRPMSRPQHESKPQTFTRQRRLARDQGLTDPAVANTPAAQGIQVDEGHHEVVAVCSRGRYVIEVG